MDWRWVRDRAERGQVYPNPDDCHLDLLFLVLEALEQHLLLPVVRHELLQLPRLGRPRLQNEHPGAKRR